MRNTENPPNSEWIGPALRRLPKREPSDQLCTSLRVMASRERQRHAERQDLSARLTYWRNRLDLLREDFLRSIALPFAGGVFSTVVLFSMFVVPAYPLFSSHMADDIDVPTMLTTAVSIKGISPFVTGGGDVVVDVRVDEQGRMIDYVIVTGAAAFLANPEMRRRLENMLLFTEFVPATEFGVPRPSKVRVSLGSSRVEVKG